jgi:predicted trehalose synthase
VEAVAPLLPGDPGAVQEVLAAFELDKAVYELAYELAYRPDQVGIPAEGISRLVKATPA